MNKDNEIKIEQAQRTALRARIRELETVLGGK